jgi:O-Antigen ligase
MVRVAYLRVPRRSLLTSSSMGAVNQVAMLGLMALALMSLLTSRAEIARAWQSGTRLQAASAQVLVTGGMLSVTTLVASRTLLQMATVAVFLGTVVWAELFDSREFGRSVRRPIVNQTPVWLILALWFWLFAVNLWFVIDEDASEALYRVISGVVLFIYVVAQRYRPITATQFYSASLVTLALIVVALPLWPNAFIPCGKFKCNQINAILQGPFLSGNTLGLAAGMCAALLVTSTLVRSRHVFVALFLISIIYTTMSRTAFIAFGVTGLLVVVDRVVRSGRLSWASFNALAKVTAACVAILPLVTSMYLIFESDSDAFSNRGRIWRLGRDAVAESPLVGRGLDRWEILSDAGYFGKEFALFTHSEYLLFYFSGGIVALVLFALILYRIAYLSIAGHRSMARGAAVPLTFAVCGVIETVWNPLTIDSGTWLFFAVVAVVCGQPARTAISDFGTGGTHGFTDSASVHR